MSKCAAAAAVLVCAALTACGSPAATTTTTQPAAAATNPAPAGQTSTDASSGAEASSIQVVSANGTVTVKGSGDAESQPIPLALPYYIAKISADDMTSVLVTEKGADLPVLTVIGNHTAIYRPGSKSPAWKVEATGPYTIELGAPVASSPADPAPKTFTGAQGTTVTPAVSVPAGYVTVKVAYKGTADANAPSGQMLATATLYDAATSESVLGKPVYVNKTKTTEEDGRDMSKAGVYFLIVTGQSAADSWEVTVSAE